MINYIEARAAEGSVGSQGIPEAFDARREHESGKAEIDRDIAERMAALNAELAEIEHKMEEISKKYEDK